MELDLNQEPLDHQTSSSVSVVEFDSVLEELEAAEGNIRSRIRHLEEITSRARESRGLPRRTMNSPIRITNFTGDANANAASGGDVREDVRDEEEREERSDVEKGGKRKSAHLVAKALGVEEVEDGKVEESSGGFYDCNICLDVARDPVLTCCGHLFCWPCFYQLSYVYSRAKECPVCKGEVTEAGVIPIYGNGNAGGDCEMEMKEAGLRVPPRPKAPRIESIRQKLITQGASSSSIVQSIRRFHNRIGGFGEQAQLESPNSNTRGDRNNGRLARSRTQTDINQHAGTGTGTHQVSRLLEQGASSFSSLSSALNSAMDSAERLVQDLESYIHGHNIGGSREVNTRADNRSSIVATNHSESRGQDVVDVANYDAAAARSLENMAAIGSEIQTTDRNMQISPLDPSSSNSRRRNGVSRQVSNEPRRRRRLR